MTAVRSRRSVLLVTTTLTANVPDASTVPYTCPVCHVEFRSFATWTRKDGEHYLASRNYPTVIVDDNEGVTDRDNVDAPANWTGGVKSSRSSSPDLATEKQLGFLARLRAERNLPTPENETLTKRQASKLIDAVMATPKPANVHTADPGQPAPAARSNRFDAPCATCRQTVEAGTGSLTSENGRWTVRHIGACPTPAPVSGEAGPLSDVADGYYAIASTGTNDLAFYRVKHSDRYGVSVSLVVGGHADSYVRRSAVAGILARIAADADAAKRYADEIGSCYRCNRTLTDEESRRLGIGPTCRNLG